jgi:hypothetical protein
MEGGCQRWTIITKHQPEAVKSHKMKNQVEVVKGIQGFISYWYKLIEKDSTGAIRQKMRTIIKYWEGMKADV